MINIKKGDKLKMSNQTHKMTQVGITIETRARLRSKRITKHESYDEIIIRLLDLLEEMEESDKLY